MSVSPWPDRAGQPSAPGVSTRRPTQPWRRPAPGAGSPSLPHFASAPVPIAATRQLAGRIGGPARVAGRARVIVLVLMFIAGIGVVAAMNVGIAVTNEMDFCVSCHTMQTNYLEYQETSHFKNPSGVQATCADCHVPKPFGPKLVTKVVAAKDVWHEVIGTIDTPEKFEARRGYMANLVWDRMRRNNSRECRSCHEFANMDLSQQSRTARARHSRAEERGQTCIDCHAGIVHAMPSEPLETPPATAQTDDS